VLFVPALGDAHVGHDTQDLQGLPFKEWDAPQLALRVLDKDALRVLRLYQEVLRLTVDLMKLILCVWRRHYWC